MKPEWLTIEHVGYQGENKDEHEKRWSGLYGRNNWRIIWRLSNGEEVDFDYMFERYVDGYEYFLRTNLDEAERLSQVAAYTYDKDIISRGQAFEPKALVGKAGIVNQFHHVALNIALEDRVGIKFKGDQPIQVREGKPGTPVEAWPVGWRFSPGRIACCQPELIPKVEIKGWWQENSIEDLYQSTKVLQIRKI